MRLIHIATASAGLATALLLGSCATMSEEQCLAGNWSGQGYSDGRAGYGWSRLTEHAEACAKHGITPDNNAYYEGHARGVRAYCQPANGYRLGVNGSGISNGFCPADLESDFRYAYADGRTLYDANQRVNDLQSRVYQSDERVRDLERQMQDQESQLGAEGLTDEQRRTIRDRIRTLRGDRDSERDAANGWRYDLDQARREQSAIQNRMGAIYGY